MTDFDRSIGPPPTQGAGVFLQVGLGIALVFAMHFAAGGCVLASILMVGSAEHGPIQAVLTEWVGWLAVGWSMGVGVVQVVYVGPAAAAAFFVRRAIALGMLIGAAITFALQGACYGYLAASMLGAFR